MHVWLRGGEQPERGWERKEIPDAGLSLGCGPAGRLEIAPGVSDRALAVIVPFEEYRARRAALLTRPGGEPCLLNGFPSLAAAVLEERDELIVGSQVLYFGAHGAAVTERFVEGPEPTFCPRCKCRIAPGDEVTRCPACPAIAHEGALAEKPSEIRRCFSYFGEPCAACGRSVDELLWSPEEIWGAEGISE